MKGSGKPPGTFTGPTLRELAFQKLDAVMDRLMDATLDEQPISPTDRGEAKGMAEIIAIFTDPYNPDVDAIRAEATERWEARNAE